MTGEIQEPNHVILEKLKLKLIFYHLCPYLKFSTISPTCVHLIKIKIIFKLFKTDQKVRLVFKKIYIRIQFYI